MIMDGNATIDTKKETSANKRKIINAVVIIIIVAVATVGYLWWRNLENFVSTDNAKVAGDITDISPKVSGRLIKLTVQEGDTVQAGQVIAELDSDQFKINLNQAKATLDLNQANYDKLPDDVKSAAATVEKAVQTLAATQAQLKAAQLTAADSQRNLNQSEQLYQSNAISKEALDASTSACNKAQAAVDAAQASLMANQAALEDSQAKLDSLNKTGDAIYLAGLEQAQAAYDAAQLSLDNAVIKAPVSGTIVQVTAQIGENLSVGQTILSISDLDSTWVSTNIDEDQYGRLQVGQSVQVQVDAYPGTTFTGTVSELGGATQATFALIPTESTSGNYTKVKQRFTCKIAVDKQGLVLKPGMSAVVKIRTGK